MTIEKLIPSSVVPASANSDLIYGKHHRKGWKTGRTYPYKNEQLSIAEISVRAECRDSKVRQYLNGYSWTVERFFGKFGDAAASTLTQENK